MGKVGEVGNWKEGLVPVTIEDEDYFYDPEIGKWYDSGGEMDFEMAFDLEGGRFYFDAGGRRFVDRNHMAMSVDANVAIEEQVKKKYDLNGEVSFYGVEREGMPIYRN